jgi:hypothetical protein
VQEQGNPVRVSKRSLKLLDVLLPTDQWPRMTYLGQRILLLPVVPRRRTLAVVSPRPAIGAGRALRRKPSPASSGGAEMARDRVFTAPFLQRTVTDVSMRAQPGRARGGSVGA